MLDESQKRALLAVADSLRERVYEYAVDDDRFVIYRRDAWQLFFGPRVPPGQLPDEHPDWDAFDDWFIFDTRLSDDLTPFARYLRDETSQLPAAERDLAERWLDDRLGVFRVVRVAEGAGAELEDLATGERLIVPTVPLSRRGDRWDLLVGRLVPLGEGFAFTTPPRYLLPALASELPGDFVGREPLAQRRERAVELWRTVRALATRQPRIPITDEGDPVRPSQARFQLVDEREARVILGQLPFLGPGESPAPGEWWSWRGSSPGGQERILLGMVGLTGGELLLECLSPERLARGRRLLEPALGRTVAFLDESVADFVVPDEPEHLSAEDTARSEAAGQTLGALLQVVSRGDRLAALNLSAEGSELATIVEHFETEPVAILARLHHRGRVAVHRVRLRGERAAVEFAVEPADSVARTASALLQEQHGEWRVARIRPGGLDEPADEAIRDDSVLAAVWSGEWQWAPVGTAADHPILGIALARLHRSGRMILQQAAAIRLWLQFVARSSPAGTGNEEWGIGLQEVSDWLAGHRDRPTGRAAERIVEALLLSPATELSVNRTTGACLTAD